MHCLSGLAFNGTDVQMLAVPSLVSKLLVRRRRAYRGPQFVLLAELLLLTTVKSKASHRHYVNFRLFKRTIRLVCTHVTHWNADI